MANFIHGYGNRVLGFPLINLDCVAMLVPEVADDGITRRYRAVAADGSPLGHITPSSLEDAKHGVPFGLLPSTPGVVLLFPTYDDAGHRITGCERRPLLGWLVTEAGEASPITCESLPERWFLEISDGFGPYLWAEPDTEESWQSYDKFLADITAAPDDNQE